jgi:transposase
MRRLLTEEEQHKIAGIIVEQMELQFEELESSATEDKIAAEMAVAKTTTVAGFTRKRPARKPFPTHLTV